jgi:hypothetical protein
MKPGVALPAREEGVQLLRQSRPAFCVGETTLGKDGDGRVMVHGTDGIGWVRGRWATDPHGLGELVEKFAIGSIAGWRLGRGHGDGRWSDFGWGGGGAGKSIKKSTLTLIGEKVSGRIAG